MSGLEILRLVTEANEQVLEDELAEEEELREGVPVELWRALQ